MSDRGDKAREEFFSEAQEIIDGMSRDFLLLDSALQQGKEEPAVLNSVFRGVHTLKGLCGMFGETHMSALSHELESLLDSLRLGKVALDEHVLDLLFQGMEILGSLLVQSHEQGDAEPDKHFEAFLHELRKVTEGSQRQRTETISYRLDPSMLAVLTEYEEHRLRTAVNNGMRLYQVHVNFDLANIDGGLEQLRQSVAPYGEILTYLPTASGDDVEGISLDVLVASSADIQTLRAALGETVSSVSELPKMVSSVAAEASAATVPPPGEQRDRASSSPVIVQQTRQPVETDPLVPPDPDVTVRHQTSWPAAAVTRPTGPAERRPARSRDLQNTTSLRSVAQTVRVDIRRLDRLMNRVGELRLVSNEFEKLLNLAREGAAVELYRSLKQVHHRLERQLGLLQNGILEVRMVPLAQVFEKLERVTRQAGRETGKRANLVITGAETEVDKLIGEDLGDPLMHMIRNAIAHGIEDEAQRRQVGKPLKGTVAVNAYHRGNQVVVEVEDDGAGIDGEKLVRAAIDRGLITEQEARELNEQEKLALLFLPGISTRSDGDALSGRGVGMDVVKTNIGKLGGVVDVQSQKGVGTKFTVTLPITLAMIRALLVESRDNTFAIPIANIEEVLRFDPRKVDRVEGRAVIPVHGVSLPLCPLADLFKLDDRSDDERADLRAGRIVIVSAASRRCGLLVDEIQQTQDIVIKPLTGSLRSWPGFAGATELGNKRIGLVIDVPGLLEESLGSVVTVRNKELETA